MNGASSKLGLGGNTSEVKPSPSAPKVDDKTKDPSSDIKNKFDQSSDKIKEDVNGLSSKLGLTKTTSVTPSASAPKDQDSSKDKLNDLSNKLGGKDKVKNVAIFAGVFAVIAAIGGAIAAFLPQIPGLKLPAIPGIPGR